MNFIKTMSGLKASMTCIQTGDEDYENLEVDLKIVAGNKQKLKSNGKVLTIKNKTVSYVQRILCIAGYFNPVATLCLPK